MTVHALASCSLLKPALLASARQGQLQMLLQRLLLLVPPSQALKDLRSPHQQSGVGMLDCECECCCFVLTAGLSKTRVMPLRTLLLLLMLPSRDRCWKSSSARLCGLAVAVNIPAKCLQKQAVRYVCI